MGASIGERGYTHAHTKEHEMSNDSSYIRITRLLGFGCVAAVGFALVLELAMGGSPARFSSELRVWTDGLLLALAWVAFWAAAFWVNAYEALGGHVAGSLLTTTERVEVPIYRPRRNRAGQPIDGRGRFIAKAGRRKARPRANREGLWIDAAGKWRRPDGRYASRAELQAEARREIWRAYLRRD